MKPRIGLIIGQLGQGGAERQLTILATGLKKTTNFEPVVYCVSQLTSPYGEELDAAGVEWHSPHLVARSPVTKSAWLIQQVKANRCDLLYGFLSVGNVYAGLAAWVLHIPLIASVRNVDNYLPLIIRILSGIACSHACEVIVNSKSSALSMVKDLKVKNKTPIIIPNGIRTITLDPSKSEVLRSKFNIPRQSTVIGTIAALRKQKRQDFFIDVAKYILSNQVIENQSGQYFIWIGEGIERKRVNLLLNNLPLSIIPHIIFPGSSINIDEWLSCFDIFILTSAYEGLPNALMEAMSAGLPCIATAVEGTVDLLDPSGQEILTWAPPDDPVRFAQILYEVINDNRRMARMGKSAQEHIRGNFTIEKMIESHCAVFEKVLSNYHR